ncbi:lysosomal proton-coupled steroid conjugate and bile acid symporter SLC46A3-like [Mytilus edulis]|uniref:lysosomal proton-coupled steroid conjugate and bile acid symporter SLC46A3-like n=1 Tax=Mytilus edulis TaxID=6550 RepID=UPI0039EFA5EB
MSKEKEDEEKPEEEPVPKLRIRHLLMPVIIILMTFGNVVVSTAETQFAYFAVQKEYNISSVVSASRQSLCEANKSSPLFKQQQKIQSITANWNAYCHLAQSVPVLFMSLMVGSWSDVIGRRAALFIPTFGLIFKSAFFAIGIKLEWNIYTFVIAFFVDGLCGMWISLLASAYSFTADLTNYGKSRMFGVVFVDMTLGVGIALGVFTSGYIIKFLGFLYGSVLMVGVGVLLCFLISLLPESKRSTNKISSTTQFEYLKNAVSFYFKKSPTRYKYILLAIVFSFQTLPNIGRINVQSLYVMNTPFCWNSVLIGLFGGVRSVAQTIVGVSLALPLYKCMSKDAMVIIGSLSAIGYYVLTALATNDIMIFMTPVVGLLLNFPVIVIRSEMSQITPRERQGALYGSIAAIDSVCSLIGSVLSNLLYGGTVSVYRGFAWLAFGGCHIVGLLFFGLYMLTNKEEKKKGLQCR